MTAASAEGAGSDFTPSIARGTMTSPVKTASRALVMRTSVIDGPTDIAIASPIRFSGFCDSFRSRYTANLVPTRMLRSKPCSIVANSLLPIERRPLSPCSTFEYWSKLSSPWTSGGIIAPSMTTGARNGSR